MRRLSEAQVVRFALVGGASTLLNLALFALFAQVMSNQPANALALVLCTVVNTAVNRRFTFGVDGHAGHLRVQLQSLGLLAVTWSATALALALLERSNPHAGTGLATVTVAVANLVATAVRFVLLKKWFAPTPSPALLDGSVLDDSGLDEAMGGSSSPETLPAESTAAATAH